MTNQNSANLRAQLVKMAESHEAYIEKLTVWKGRGVKLGPTSIEDIIDREDKAAKNLRKAIASLETPN